MQMREKVGKSRNTMFFQWFVAPEGRKVGSLKRRVQSHLARRGMKNCALLWRGVHFEVKMYKTHHARTTFGSCDVEKVHAVVARSTFRSQNVKHLSTGPLLEVAMSKKCTSLWREAHFEVNMYKKLQYRTTFGSCDVEKVHAIVVRSTFRSENVQSTRGSDHFWRFRCRKSARRCGAKHISKWKWQNTRGSDHFWRFRCRFVWQAQGIVHLVKSEQKREGFVAFSTTTTTTPHYTPIHYTTLHDTTFHYTSLHCTTLHSTTLQLQLHSTTLHYTKLHYTTLHYTTFHYTSLHYTTLHSTTLQLQLHNYTPLHPLH